MRLVLLLVSCALVAAATGGPTSATTSTLRSKTAVRSPDRRAVELVRLAADSLVARHRVMPTGGWAWRSAIQAPHFHTDRDVGAASVGEGLLAAYRVTRDARYLRAAEAAGDFLLGVAERDAGGVRWPDWADPDGRRSSTHYTSFDDGAAGISDYLWTLFTVSHQPRFREGALAGMRWLIAQAEGPSCPRTECVWRWTDDASWRAAFNGVGMGQAGIVLALDGFADRTGDATFRAYARAGAERLRLMTENGMRPLPRGSDDPLVYETGFLSGSAGVAFMFFERYTRDRDRVDLATADRLLRWVNRQAVPDVAGGLSWPVAGGDAAAGSGFQLGAAGIAWVNLQAAQLTGKPEYRGVARRAAAWLRSVMVAGGAWRDVPEDVTSPLHVGLDSGAAGIGWVLEDMARKGIDTTANRTAARSALAGIRAATEHDRLGALWYENRTGTSPHLRAEPSWHWGAAGIAAFAARLAGWSSGPGPGGQPST